MIVPGGPGVRLGDDKLAPVVDFVGEAYPVAEHLINVCMGSRIAAKAGTLDGRHGDEQGRLGRDHAHGA